MAHRLASILELARRYQQSVWQYQSLSILNPYFLASIGYIPVQYGKIRCHICLKEVSIKFQGELLSDQLLHQLKNHAENCIYQGEEPINLKKQDIFLAMDQISNDINESSTNDKYPLLNSYSVWDYTSSNAYFLKKIMKLYEINTQRYTISFFLRLFGWQFKKNQQNVQCLQCYFCGRSLPLQQFRLTQSPDQDPEKEKQSEEQQLFNPIQEHRYFCLWTGPQQNYVLFLQDFEDKYAEYSFFKIKVKPLSTKKMKVHIDKYLESFKQKIEGSVAKLKQVSQQFTKLCGQLSDNSVADLSKDLLDNSKKRIRSIQREIEETGDKLIEKLKNPSKRVKQNEC